MFRRDCQHALPEASSTGGETCRTEIPEISVPIESCACIAPVLTGKTLAKVEWVGSGFVARHPPNLLSRSRGNRRFPLSRQAKRSFAESEGEEKPFRQDSLARLAARY